MSINILNRFFELTRNVVRSRNFSVLLDLVDVADVDEQDGLLLHALLHFSKIHLYRISKERSYDLAKNLKHWCQNHNDLLFGLVWL